MRNYLKTLRKEQGLKQKDVAICCGLAPSYYCMIENGIGLYSRKWTRD